MPIYLGGPVGHDQLGFADLAWDPQEQILQLETNLSLDAVAERLKEHPGRLRAFVGYAGWGVGQLEGELAQKAWVLVKPREDAALADKGDKLWFRIMSSLGPEYKLLASVPDDPTLN